MGAQLEAFFFMMIAVYKSIKTILGRQTLKRKKTLGPCARRYVPQGAEDHGGDTEAENKDSSVIHLLWHVGMSQYLQ